MAYTYKHGGHDFALDLPALAAGAAADTSCLYAYRPFFVGTRDAAVEFVLEASLTFDAAVSAVATNNFEVDVVHYRPNAAGTAMVVQDQVNYANAGAGITATANLPINLAVVAGGNIAVPTGNSLLTGWQLLEGDVIVIKRKSNGTGQASPAFTVTLTRGVKA